MPSPLVAFGLFLLLPMGLPRQPEKERDPHPLPSAARSACSAASRARRWVCVSTPGRRAGSQPAGAGLSSPPLHLPGLGGLFQESVDSFPEFVPVGAFGLGQFAKGLAVTQASQVSVLSPLVHLAINESAVRGLAGVQELAPGGEVVAQPAKPLTTQMGEPRFVGRGWSFVLPGGGEGR